MENISQKKQNRKSNVSNIADNPRYTRPSRKIALTKNLKANSDLCTFTLTENVFGLSEGDMLICQRDFDESKLSSLSLVISENENGRTIKPYNETLNVFAVIVAFQREVSL